MKRKVIILLSGILLYSCASAPKFRSEKNAVPKTGTGVSRYSDVSARADSVLETQTGTASYYAEDFHGKITYSGEVYDMDGISAAHPFYPMGTILRITNLSNGKQITLTVNDKMPYREDRIIDLSRGAAKALGMVTDGLAKVKIEVLKWGEGRK